MRRALVSVIAALLASPAAAKDMHEPLVGAVILDQLELRLGDGEAALAWEGDAWYGGDYHRVWVKSNGELREGHGFEEAETQLLYSRLIGHFWDLQAGLRHDFRPRPSRSYAVLGVQGLAPGVFEVDLQGFVSERGDVSARLEAEYDLLVTQRLVLQPKAELGLAVQDVPELGIGSGVTDIELGLRLRYEIAREFAPYVGVHWERKLGDTADFARAEGESADALSFVAGIRFWF